MTTFFHSLRTWCEWLRDQRGAASAEYALILTLVVIILIGSLTTLGAVLNDRLQDIIGSIQGVQ